LQPRCRSQVRALTAFTITSRGIAAPEALRRAQPHDPYAETMDHVRV
jgi:hypothetical protein